MRADAAQNLRTLAASLAEYPNTDLLIVGHADAVGTTEYNQTLAQRRAVAAVSYLIAQGVSPARLSAVDAARPVVRRIGASRSRSSRMRRRALVSARAHLVRQEEDVVKKGFIENIEDLTADNGDFRRVIYTAQHMQLVLMSLSAGEEIGEELHTESDQFFRIETGAGEVWMNGIATD